MPCCEDSVCKKVNGGCMILAAVLCIAGGIIILYAGVAIYSVPYDKAVDDGTVGTLGDFLSCKSQYDLAWNKNSSTAYIRDELVRGLTVGSCSVNKAGPITLSAFTGFFVLCTGIAGVWSAMTVCGTSCQSHGKSAVFSSGITISFTVALLVVCVAYNVQTFGKMAIQFVACESKGGDDFKFDTTQMLALKQAGYYCMTGHTDGTNGTVAALPTMKVHQSTVKTLVNFAEVAGLYTVGIVLSFIAQFFLKYTSTSAHYYNEATPLLSRGPESL